MMMKNHGVQRRFIRRIQREIATRGWTVQHLADVSELPPSTAWRLLRGERRPSFSQALAICKALGIETGEL